MFMIKKIAIPLLLMSIGMGCSKKPAIVTPVITIPKVDTPIVGQLNSEHYNVLTQHNDNTRAGFNSHETVLTAANVNAKQFGLLFALHVDDYVFAQPLVYGNLNISSGTHNVVFIATVNNSVYAFDGTTGSLYWKKNFTVAGLVPPTASQMNSSWCTPYNDIPLNIGIIGTPAIDSASQTMYFVARSTNGANFYQYLHAINIVTGTEQPGSPVAISASLPGTGDGSVSGTVSFDPLRNNQRQALTLVNGVVYISWSSHCDWNPYHGWIIGYNKTTLKQQIVYVDTPNGEAGGLWESGQGMAADAQGNLYVVSGNGTVGDDPFTSSGNGTTPGVTNTNPSDLTNRGESAMKLTPSGSTFQISSFFTPQDYQNLDVNDLDYGVMGAFLIPNTSDFLTGCKDGNLYLLNKDNMGGYSLTSNLVQQTIPLNVTMHCQPSYYEGSNNYIYVWSENDQLRQFSFAGGQLANNPTVSGDEGPTAMGADLSVSSNGAVAGTGILWASYGTTPNNVGNGILRAFDATNVTKDLWNSNQTNGDFVGNYAKFSSPTVVNGHVYLATFSNQVMVYGLK
jgi:hypothetical protein